MPSDTVQYCARCKKAFREGQGRYLVTINVVADFDGTIGAPEGAEEFRRMWEEVEHKTEDELMNEVVQRMSFTLCRPCRDSWVRSPLCGPEAGDEAPSGHVH